MEINSYRAKDDQPAGMKQVLAMARTAKQMGSLLIKEYKNPERLQFWPRIRGEIIMLHKSLDALQDVSITATLVLERIMSMNRLAQDMAYSFDTELQNRIDDILVSV